MGNDVATLMQNLNKTAANSTSLAPKNSCSNRKLSGFSYSGNYDNSDDSEDEVGEYVDDDIDEEECFNDSESETEPDTADKSVLLPEIQVSYREPSDLKSDLESIRNIFGGSNIANKAENASEDDIKSDAKNVGYSVDTKDTINLDASYPNFELEEDIDSENLISDEEDDNESGFLSQI